MGRIIVGYLVLCPLFVGLGYSAETITGDACYRYSDRESIQDARTTVLALAKRNALEGYTVFVESTSEIENFDLKSDIIESVSAAFLRNLQILDETLDRESQEICVRISADVEPVEVRGRILETMIAEGSISNLQNIIERQNQEFEDLRQRSLDAQRKEQMLGIIERQKEIIDEIEEKGLDRVPYTSRQYAENLAFVNIESNFEGVDTYINGRWIGRTPVRLYELEAGESHRITLRPDPRYFKSATIQRTYSRFQRAIEHITIRRETSQILLLTPYRLLRVIVNETDVYNNPQKALFEVPAGRNTIEVYDEQGYAEIEFDIWANETIRRDLTEADYTSEPFFGGGIDDSEDEGPSIFDGDSIVAYFIPSLLSGPAAACTGCFFQQAGIGYLYSDQFLVGVSKSKFRLGMDDKRVNLKDITSRYSGGSDNVDVFWYFRKKHSVGVSVAWRTEGSGFEDRVDIFGLDEVESNELDGHNFFGLFYGYQVGVSESVDVILQLFYGVVDPTSQTGSNAEMLPVFQLGLGILARL